MLLNKDMNYIETIRKKIGHDPIIMCGCGCLIFNDLGQILLQKRSDDGLWGNPGGCMEIGETIYDTVKREVFEETGLIVSDLELFNIYSGEEQHHIYPNKDEVYIVNIVFKANRYSGNLLINDKESKELRFFDLEDIPLNVVKPFLPIKKDLLK